MKLGIITYGLSRGLTGIGRYTQEAVSAISNLMQDDIAVLTSGGTGELNKDNINVTALPGCKLAPSLMSLGQIELSYFANQLELDIIHDMSAMTPLSLIRRSTKRVVTIYDVIPWSYPGVSTRWDTLVYKNWLPFISSRTDAILTISETSRQDIANFLHYPIEQIHNIKAGKSDIYRVHTKDEIMTCLERLKIPEPYLLFVGSLEQRKNLIRVVKAFVELKENENIPHKLVLVGPKSGKYHSVMNEIINSKLADQIVLTGYVEESDLPMIYGGADVLLFPSLYEGFGLPVIEAMACGTPVITSNVSSLPEVAGDSAVLIDPLSINEIKNAIRLILSDSALQESMIQSGLRQTEKFTWEHTAQKTIEVYETLLASG